MRLSEAIRLGSMLGPQTFGTLFDGSATCANGAARRALGLTSGLLSDRYPWLKQEAACPVCSRSWRGEHYVPFLSVIASCLNDTHRWTRERIADWVEMVEPKEEVAIVAEQVVNQLTEAK